MGWACKWARSRDRVSRPKGGTLYGLDGFDRFDGLDGFGQAQLPTVRIRVPFRGSVFGTGRDAHRPGEWQLPKLELLAALQLSKRSVEGAEWAFGRINHGFQDEAVGEVSLGLSPGLQGCFENGGGLNI